jgi:DNA polymerase II large subunit
MTNRYHPLKTNYSDTPVLVIDTEADPHAILDAAHQRIRAASDLLETLYCQNFKEADPSDIPNIINALYLLTQDGHELLEIARRRLPKTTTL